MNLPSAFLTRMQEMLGEDLAAQALSEKRIVSIPLTEEIPNRYICLVRDPSRPLGAAARCLIDMLLADRMRKHKLQTGWGMVPDVSSPTRQRNPKPVDICPL